MNKAELVLLVRKLRATAQNLYALALELDCPKDDQAALTTAAAVLFRYVGIVEKELAP